MEGHWIVAGLRLLSIIQALPIFTQGNIQDKYIGCYYDDVNDQNGLQKIPLQNNTTLTIELCIGQCWLQSSTYARLENSVACLCGNNVGAMLPDTSCKSLCPGSQAEYCGGSNGQRAFYSLYAVCEIGYYGYMCDQVCHCKRQAPCDRMTGQCPNGCEEKWFGTTCSDTLLSEKYIGCFRDGDPRAISPDYCYSAQMTLEMCSNSCILRNYSIAALQNGRYCTCGENYAKYGPLYENACRDPCYGNSSQICGGGWANSVYSVCPDGYYGPKCHDQCHCFNNSRCVYITGECNSTCKAGWSGASCNIRDCSAGGGDCFQNENCTTIDLKFAKVTRCRCLPGFGINTKGGPCSGIPSDAYNEHSTTTSTIFNQQGIPSDAYNEHSTTSTIFNQQAVPLGVAIVAAVGSALGPALVVIGIFMWRRRRQQQQRKSEDSSESQHRAHPDERLENTVLDLAYETLNSRQTQDESIYSELSNTEVAPQ